MTPARLLPCLLVTALMASCQSETSPEKPVKALADEMYFVQYVKPLFATHCVSCHRGSNAPAGLSLVQRSGLYAPRRNGRAFVVPGDPSASLLLSAIEPGGSHPRTIPRVTGSLNDWELGALYEWIEDGAYWPDNPEGFVQPVTALHRALPQ